MNHAGGNDLQPVQAIISEYLHAAFSSMKDTIFFLLGRVQQPAPCFPHKPFSLAVALILGFLQVTSQGKGSKAEPLFDSNPTLYYTAVAAFLVYCWAGGLDIVSSSHPVRPLPAEARNVLHRFIFLAGSLSFAATASFLFPDSVRPVMFALVFIIISATYLTCCVYHFYIHRDVIV